MRFNKVLLVQPPSSSYLGAARPPANLGYLAETLSQNKVNYDVLDMRIRHKLKHLKSKVENYQPDLIGLSLVSLEYRRNNELITVIKSCYPEIRIVVGGPHVTVTKEKVLEDCSAIDYAVVYEGEETIVDLCLGEKNIEGIKGLIFRDHGKIIANRDRVPLSNLDEIPFPKYEKFELNKYTNEGVIISSRGCPFKCIFCPNRLLAGEFRPRSASNVVDEIAYWYDRGIRQFNFDDDNFGLLKDRVYAICDEIEKRSLEKLFLRCSNGLRADRIDRPLLARMREVGFGYIGFGVDGGNNKVLRTIKKGETIETIEEAIKNACELGYIVKLFFIVGSPGETKEDIEDTLNLVIKYPIQRVYLNNPIPYPGTELYNWIEKNNRFIKRPEEYLNAVAENMTVPVFDTAELPKDERIEILNRCQKIEKQVMRRGLTKRFGGHPLIKGLVGYLLATDFIENLFFKNNSFRKIVDKIVYRKLTTA